MPAKRAHEPRVLAESRNVSVSTCSGACVHLQFGRVAMSVTRQEFAEIAAVLRAAAERLQLESAPHGNQRH